MKFPAFQLARISGIPLMIDYSWPLVVGLHFWLVAVFFLPQRALYVELPEQVFFGLLMTALFFASIVLHELAHAFVAKMEGIRTLEIRLKIFGGLAQFAKESPTPMTDLRIAVAGPAMSFLVGLFFLLCLVVVIRVGQASLYSPWRATFWYLSFGNIILAMFNLIPALPLDGGRVLRAWLWHRSRNILAATRTAAKLGVALSYMLVSYAIYSAVWSHNFIAAASLFIAGFFIKQSAENELRYREYQASFGAASSNVPAAAATPGTVGAVMSAPPVLLSPDMRVSEFIEQVLEKHRLTSFPVARDGRLHGMLSLERLKELPEDRWPHTLIREVMLPVDDSLFITARASVEHAASKLKTSRLRHLAVIDSDGLVVGFLSDADLKRAG